MMKIKFNHFERMAGLFVVGASLAFVIGLIGVAVKQGWFDSKTSYSSVFDEADGIHTGTLVQIAGLRAGTVDSVELTDENRILIRFHIFSKFDSKIREDSTAQLVRPFVIGDRMLELTVGTDAAKVLGANGQLKGTESVDLMALMSGRRMGDYLGSLNEGMKNLRYLAEAFLDKSRTENLVKMFDNISPLLANMNTMSLEVTKLSRQATRDERFGTVMRELALTTKEMNQFLPMLREKAPSMARDTEKLITNLATLTDQFKLLTPAFTEIAPELPKASRRAIEALDETVVLLKAMQKSWFLKSNSREVREEEAAKDKARERKPASE